MVNSTVVQIIQDVDLLCLIRNNHITRSSKPTQAQGLCGLTRCYDDSPLACPLKKIYEKTFYNIINWVFKY